MQYGTKGCVVSNDKSGTTEEKTEVRFNVRVPPSIHERLTNRAKVNGVSMNTEILDILTEALFLSGDPQEERLRTEATRLHTMRDALLAQIAVVDERLKAIDFQLQDLAVLRSHEASIVGPHD